jgi:hypothetical protein
MTEWLNSRTNSPELNSRIGVRVRVTLRLAVYRQSVRLSAEPLETHGQKSFSQLNTCRHSPYKKSSLTGRWVCNLLLLLAFASAFILRSESRGTRNHILLSQIRDFSFCYLLRLAGLRWRYSTSPPRGKLSNQLRVPGCNLETNPRFPRPWRPLGLWEIEAPTFSDIGSQMAAALSALLAGQFLLPGWFLVFILLEAESTPGPLCGWKD